MTAEATDHREKDGPWLWRGADLVVPESRRFAGGQAVAYTHRSPSRDTNNQDSSALIPCRGPGSPRCGTLVVADGAGGHADGDHASSLAVTHIAQALWDAPESESGQHQALQDGIEAAQREILRQTDDGMTTLLVAEVRDDTVRLIHAGDSVALLIGKRGRIRHSTVPHSPVGYAVQAGLLDERAAMTHHARHIISNALGMPELHLERGPLLKVAPKDTLLLASDGLFDNLSTQEIVDIVSSGPLELAVIQLVEQSRSRMLAGPTAGAPCKPDDLTILAWRPLP